MHAQQKTVIKIVVVAVVAYDNSIKVHALLRIFILAAVLAKATAIIIRTMTSHSGAIKHNCS